MSNEKIIGVVTLFPGIVTVVVGVMVKFPEMSVPVQNTPSRLTLFKAKDLPAGPPLVEFQTTWILRTVTGSCGLVIVRLIVGLPPVILIAPVVMLPQPGTGVEVLVGVKVIVGVKVMVGVRVSVKVGVTVGVSVIVLLGRGVNVIKSPPGSVAVGVSDGPVGVKVGVLDGTAVAGTVGAAVLVEPVVGTTLFPEFISRIPSIAF